MKNNKQYEKDDRIMVSFRSMGTIPCDFVRAVSGGYTRAIVRDMDDRKPDALVIGSGKSWCKNSNLGLHNEYEIHVNQIVND